MIKLTNTAENIELVQEFINETKKRINNGVSITFTKKALEELRKLILDFDIDKNAIKQAILNLSPDNYFRGIDPSNNNDFSVCAFRVFVGNDNLEIYLKYGLERNKLQILIFSNHKPNYPMEQSFRN